MDGFAESDKSDRSGPSDEGSRLLPKHGGYHMMRSHQAGLALYDAAVVFCDRFIEQRSRIHDQMVQAARSGVRNIEEGSEASATSKTTELKLTNVARASLTELMGDYQDFLRQRGLPVWDKDAPQAREVRRKLVSGCSGGTDLSDLMMKGGPEMAANTMRCLINQASYLLHRWPSRLEQDFLKHGGFAERLHALRSRAKRSDASDLVRHVRQSPQRSRLPALCQNHAAPHVAKWP